jgi:hypothetical protein
MHHLPHSVLSIIWGFFLLTLTLSWNLRSSFAGTPTNSRPDLPAVARTTPGCSQAFYRINFSRNEAKEIPGRSIRQGATCGGYHWQPGPSSVFKGLFIESAPQRGKLRLQAPGQYYYTAPISYLGSDSFTLKICASLYAGGGQGCSTLKYMMNVIAR